MNVVQVPIVEIWSKLTSIIIRRAGSRAGPHGAAPRTTAAAATAAADPRAATAAGSHGAPLLLKHAALPDCVAVEPVAARPALARRARVQLSAAAQPGPRGPAHPAQGQPLPDQHAKET